MTFWIFLPYLFFTALVVYGYPEDARFAVPYLPAIALIISAAIFSIGCFRPRPSCIVLSLLIMIIALFGFAQFFELSYDPGFKSVLSSRVINCLDHGAGRYRSRLENWKGKELLAIILRQKSSLEAAEFRVMSLYNLDVINSPIKRELYASYNEWHIEYDALLEESAGGYSCIEENDFYENKIKTTDMIIIKEGGFLGISDKRTCASKVYKSLMGIFEEYRNQFYLLDDLALPDKSHLLVYQKMR